MTLTLKVLIVEPSKIRTVTLVEFERLGSYDPALSFPEYAGKRQPAALAVVETDVFAGCTIRHIDYILLPFDTEGRLRQDELDRAKWLAVNSLSMPFSTSEPEAEGGAYLLRSRCRKDFLWSPSSSEAQEVETAALGT